MTFNKEKSEKLKQEALHRLECLIDSYIDDGKSNAEKLSYWLRDYVSYLEFEKTFNPRQIKSYKRGDIIKVDLGYNIGSEEGGLHYCVVVDKKNALASPILTVIPLTSLKKDKKSLDNLPKGSVYIGTEIFDNLKSKADNEYTSLLNEVNALSEDIKNERAVEEVSNIINNLNKRVDELKKMRRENSRMKVGSIALVSQITTVSKIRIQDPKRSYDVLSGIRLSTTALDMLDAKIKELYTNI